MEIIEIKIDEIKPYKNNPRINTQTIDKVAQSIKDYGFKNPIILDKNNEIICGHTRFEAAKQLNLEKVPCIIAKDLTPKQVKEYRLVDNKTSELSWWDFDKLNEEIEKYNLDVFDYGFKDFSLEEDYNDSNSKDSEIDLDKIQEEFRNECPRCGFKF